MDNWTANILRAIEKAEKIALIRGTESDATRDAREPKVSRCGPEREVRRRALSERARWPHHCPTGGAMSANRRHSQVVNIDEVTPDEQGQGSFAFRRRRLGPEAGSRGALGCSYYELPPGKTAFPFHFHSAIEEGIYLLEGSGALRIGKETVDVRAGDYIAFPPGPDSSHQLTNTGSGTMKYLCLSAPGMPMTLDVVGYPDSKKLAFAAGIDPVKGPRAGGWVLKIIKEEQPSVGYYDDEPLAKP
jgi:uncharacterized cupin superfamily protein